MNTTTFRSRCTTIGTFLLATLAVLAFAVPDARAANTFSTTGPLAADRAHHTATLLDNGKVLVAGGSAFATLASAELYDPFTRVTTNSDSGPGSLRDVLAAATSGDTIGFDASLSGQTILLTTGQIDIDEDLTIDASALPGGITIDGNANGRIFEFSSGTTNILEGLTLTNGEATGSSPDNQGGAIYVNTTAHLTLSHCTLSGNTTGAGGDGGGGDGFAGDGGAGGNGGGIYNIANTFLRNVICAQNQSGPGGPGKFEGRDGFGDNVFGGIDSQGHNLIGDPSHNWGWNTQNGDLLGLDPMLDALADNGGPTWTMALLPGSPALEAGDNALTGTDQRGQARLSGQQVDIGAYEFDYTAATPPAGATPAAGSVDQDTNGLSSTTLVAGINPNGLLTTAFVEYGLTTNYGSSTTPVLVGSGTTLTNVNLSMGDLPPGVTIHYRLVTMNAGGAIYGSDQTLTTPAFFSAGDANGDGVVDLAEVNAVLQASGTYGLALSGPVIEYNPVSETFALSLEVKHSPDLMPPWSTLTDFTTTFSNVTGEIIVEFPKPVGVDASFFRLFGTPTQP